MNKLNAILLGIALFLPFVVGCDPATTPAISVTEVKLHDWTDPKDGKIYVVAMPTWKNDGKVAIRQAMFSADIKDAKGFKPKESAEPQFHGAIVEPGTTVTPQQVPEEGVILGVKKELEDQFGKLDESRVEVEGLGSTEEYKPPTNSDA